MFDVCVDSDELLGLLSELEKMEATLRASTSTIRGQLSALSSDLEGRQFVKANKITNMSCNTISETCVNVELLMKYLHNLISCIEAYSKLGFKGEIQNV